MNAAAVAVDRPGAEGSERACTGLAMSHRHGRCVALTTVGIAATMDVMSGTGESPLVRQALDAGEVHEAWQLLHRRHANAVLALVVGAVARTEVERACREVWTLVYQALPSARQMLVDRRWVLAVARRQLGLPPEVAEPRHPRDELKPLIGRRTGGAKKGARAKPSRRRDE